MTTASLGTCEFGLCGPSRGLIVPRVRACVCLDTHAGSSVHLNHAVDCTA